ncbi:Core-2/I-branching beta-1 [Abeliophyllum distichum]|uniref:Core-2/I-branching beta-1 n=1 Tax=Abeliophyllum distichum TaxID=126358 RepID=A0ABD1U122_9LAMI
MITVDGLNFDEKRQRERRHCCGCRLPVALVHELRERTREKTNWKRVNRKKKRETKYSLQIVSLPPVRFLSFSSAAASIFVESKLRPIPISTQPQWSRPRLAYLLFGSARDGGLLQRTLQSLYHPHNQYVVHLDAESSAKEHLDLHNYVKMHPIFGKFKNVRMITKANLVTYCGQYTACGCHFAEGRRGLGLVY